MNVLNKLRVFYFSYRKRKYEIGLKRVNEALTMDYYYSRKMLRAFDLIRQKFEIEINGYSVRIDNLKR